MSVTTTANPVTTTLFRTLEDYEIHESAEQKPQEHPAPVNSNSPPATENPEGWPEDYNNVPNFRPVDHTRDMTLRPNGLNPAETVFIFLMMNGVGINAGAAQLWRKTFGRFNPNIFKYKIGGEW
ncbi:MAG: hypothetical protein M1821_000491 [Bathelium mastoideum]|nr:MAG: hypothetical protein M1821_000491 [Bathelium mastoideum]